MKFEDFSYKDNSNMQPIFGTDGVRGVFNKELTYALAQNLGYAFGIVNHHEKVLIGRDTRLSGDLLLQALSIGLHSSGKKIIDIGICPTPTIPFLIRNFRDCAGIMISASHNPPQYNGIKFFDDHGNKLKISKEREIENYLKKIAKKDIFIAKQKINIEKFNYLEIYKKSLIHSVDSMNFNGMKILLDTCHGSATACAEDIFKELGADVHVINKNADGSKINVNCGSTCLDSLKEAMLEFKSDIGFSFDGDADRVIGIDSEGNILDGDHILFLWGRELMREKKLSNNLLISTVMANLGFEYSWKEIGGNLIRTDVGDKFIHEEIHKRKADLGGEQSGHILSNINNYAGDGILTAIQISKFCKKNNINLKDWLDSSFRAFPQNLINIKLNSNDRNFNNLLEKNINNLIKEKLEKISEPCRIFARNSGTEPVLRILVEAQNKNLVEDISINLSKSVKNFL